MTQIINIKNADYISDYKIHFEFNDGKENTIDFKPFIFASNHPDIKKYQDQTLFKMKEKFLIVQFS